MSQQSNPNIAPGRALDYNWLIDNGLRVVLPKTIDFRMKILKYLYDTSGSADVKVYDRFARVQSVVDKIGTRTLEKYRAKKWANSQIKGRKAREREKTANPQEDFDVCMIDIKDEVKYTCVFTLKGIEDLYSKAKPKEPYKPLLNIQNIATKRQQELERPMLVEPENEMEREAMAKKICEMYATGLHHIAECCNYYGIKHHDFVAWLFTNEVVRVMYMEAVAVHRFIHASEIEKMVYDQIKTVLSVGHVVNETSNFERILTPANPEGIMFEKSKNVTTRQLSPVELSKMLFMMKTAPMQGGGGGDMFDSMTADEIQGWIDDNRDKLGEPYE